MRVRGPWRSQPRPNLLIALTSKSNGPGRRHGKRNRDQASLGLGDGAPSFPVLAKAAGATDDVARTQPSLPWASAITAAPVSSSATASAADPTTGAEKQPEPISSVEQFCGAIIARALL